MSKQKIFLAGIIVLYLLNGMYSIRHLSITFDEGAHFSYGIRVLKGDPEKYKAEADNSKMPISAINAIPRAAEQIFNKGLVKSDGGQSDVLNGRYITLLFSVLTILLVFTWATQLYGPNAGLFAAFLMSLCPNNLAAAVLVTTDAYSSFFLLASMYMLWRYCNNNNTKNLIGFTVVLAVAQAAKQSLAHVYVIALLAMCVYWFALGKKIQYAVLAKRLLLFITISWLVVNACFLFYKPFMALGDYHFISHAFLQLQQALPAKFPVPMSKAFVTGLDMAKYYDQIGGGHTGNPESSFGNVTILGHSSTGGSFWYYYFITFFYKTPVATLILLGWSLYYLFTKSTLQSFIKNEWFLLLPAVYFLLFMSFLYNTQCGIRHLAFIYPLLFIFISGLLQYINTGTKKIVLAVLSIYLAASVLTYYKNYFSYTNEFIVNKTMAYKKVGASNISFNQGQWYLKQYLKDHPDVQYAPTTAQKGKFVLMLDEYMDIWNYNRYGWLKQYAPVDNVANDCYLIFDVH
jgi:hypothetical protein